MTDKTDKPKTSVMLIRHGDTDENDKHQIRGWSDPPLNEQGKKDAKDAAAKLKGSKLDAIYTSDLSRASDTADAISKATGAKVTKMKELRPWDVGKYTGHDSDDVLHLIGKYITTPDKPIPGGESFNQFRNRALGAIQSIVSKSNGKSVAVVSHHRVDALLRSIGKDGQVDPQKFCTPGIAPGDMRQL